VSTRIMHISGEWLEDTLLMGVDIPKNLSAAQAAGSVISYCRRYALASVAGIAQVDDDNQVSHERDNPPAKASKPAAKTKMPTPAQYALIQQLNKDGKLSARRKGWIEKNPDAKDSNWNTMTASQAATIIKEVQETDNG